MDLFVQGKVPDTTSQSHSVPLIFRGQVVLKRSSVLGNEKLLIKFLGEKVFLAALVPVLLAAQVLKAEPNQPDETEKQKVLRQAAQDWLWVGAKQYERSLYKEAEQSFFRAVEYQQYLTVDERRQLNNFLEKTKAELERQRVLEQIKAANELARQGRPGTAESMLEALKDSNFLTKAERSEVARTISELEKQLNQLTTEIDELYNHCVGLYLAGQLEEARQGFIKVAKSGLLEAPAGESAEDYLVKIDNILAQRTKLSPEAQTEPRKKLLKSTVTTIEDELLSSRIKGESQRQERTDEDINRPVSDSEISERRANILRSYTMAVVNDAVAKVQNYVEGGEFDKAEAAIEAAESIVNKNRAYLGDKLLQEFNDKLTELRAKIGRQQPRQSP
jgi:hypothetical protein